MINGGKFDKENLEELNKMAQNYYSKDFRHLCSGRKRLLRQQVLIKKEENDNKT